MVQVQVLVQGGAGTGAGGPLGAGAVGAGAVVVGALERACSRVSDKSVIQLN